jgi:hypothetical protein
MSEELLIRHCSPTLAGLKTGSMFRCAYATQKELLDGMRRLNRKLVCKGLRVLPLRICGEAALIYVYRPSKLKTDFEQCDAKGLLKRLGYTCESSDRCVIQLRQRMGEDGEFPHEVGLFLGYPPEDVCGFIDHKAGDCKYVGCWKVYGDAENARKTFAKFKKCTDVYAAQYAKGKSIERLTVAG